MIDRHGGEFSTMEDLPPSAFWYVHFDQDHFKISAGRKSLTPRRKGAKKNQ
jgi:hypothetical protein